MTCTCIAVAFGAMTLTLVFAVIIGYLYEHGGPNA